MALELSIPDVKEIAPGIWEASVGPRDMQAFGGNGTSTGQVSVVLLQQPYKFARDEFVLRFPLDAARALNIGNTARTIVIAAAPQGEQVAKLSAAVPAPLGPGDSAFLKSLAQLPPELEEAGSQLLEKVRAQCAGSLRGLPGGRRFQETPDNFWFVTVQPRDRSLSIVVRGMPVRLSPTRLKVVEDRRPYSRFKLNHRSDVDEAASIILSAVRRNR